MAIMNLSGGVPGHIKPASEATYKHALMSVVKYSLNRLSIHLTYMPATYLSSAYNTFFKFIYVPLLRVLDIYLTFSHLRSKEFISIRKSCIPHSS